MAITAYVGLPRSGKSYSCVRNVILPALRQGRQVFTNIPMTDLAHSEFSGQIVQYDTQDVLDNDDWFSEVVSPGALVVIDEAWRLWPAGLSVNKAKEGHKAFLAEHGHSVGGMGEASTITEIVIVTQDLSQISNFVKILVDKTYRSVKLDALGMDKRFRVSIYQGAVTGQSPSDRGLIRTLPNQTYKKDVYQYYVSQTHSDSPHGDESSTDTRANAFSGYKFKLIFASFFALLFIFVLGAKRFYESFYSGGDSSSDVSDLVHADASSAVPEVPGSSEVVVAPDVVPAFSRVGFLSSADQVYISYNNGSPPFYYYQVTVVSDGQRSVFTPDELFQLQYQFRGINQCAARITGNGYDSVVMCSTGGGERGFVREVVEGDTGV